MDKFQELTNSFKTLDFNTLNVLLDDNKSYMRVSKTLFIEKLKQEFNSAKYNSITGFHTAVVGICTCDCCHGKTVFRFVGDHEFALDLCFELTNDKIRDIRLCHQFEAAEPEEREYKSVYFYFYKDDAIDFSPDQSFIKLKSQVEKAFRDYKALEEADELNINTLKDWRDKHQQVYVEFINAMPFIHNLFRAFDEFDRVVWKVDSILKGK